MKQKLVLVDETMKSVESQRQEHHTPWGKTWTHGADVMATWKRYGFVPPTEYRNDYRFKINREGGGDDHR